MANEDLSDKAIMGRYRKANEIAILMSDRYTFESLMDVFSLLQERRTLKEEIEKLKLTIDTMQQSL